MSVWDRDWFDISKRLRVHIMISPTVYGYKWMAQGGNWTVLVIRQHDVYIGAEGT
jgi:hypothetical protein